MSLLRDIVDYFRNGWSDPEPEIRPLEDYVKYWEDRPLTDGWSRDKLLNFAGVCHWARWDPWSEED